jgi:hypothetical protein
MVIGNIKLLISINHSAWALIRKCTIDRIPTVHYKRLSPLAICNYSLILIVADLMTHNRVLVVLVDEALQPVIKLLL